MASPLRTFIAVNLTDDALAALARLSDALAERWPPRAVRWVRPRNIHLTLRFLGPTDPDLVPALGAGLDAAASAASPFMLRLEGLGTFPGLRRPRVIWVGLQDPQERLVPLKEAVDRMVRPLGWDGEDRAFRPHLTLGRVRDGARPPAGDWMRQPPDCSFEVGALHLMESRLRPRGAEYATLHSAALGGRRGL